MSDESKKKLYDQTGSTDENPFANQGFHKNQNAGFNNGYNYSNNTQSQGQGFDPNMFNQFRNNFSGGMGGF